MTPPILLDADAPLERGLQGQRNRQASVVLREEGGQLTSAMMDPANRSLADALKITFRLLQLAMIVLLGLFAFSGLQTVQEGESGLRLMFGRVAEEDLAPGMRFALPAPVGEIVRVPTGGVELEDATSFYPNVGAEARARGPEALIAQTQLNPTRDGSILTGDQAVAHIILKVQYRRTDPAAFARNVLDGATENLLVLSAARRGMVRACAEVSMDGLLREQQAGALAQRATEIAQETLDQADCGVTIERINLVQRIPPAFLRDSYNKVTVAQSNARKAQDEAQSAANQMLNSMAGLAAERLTTLINDYDLAMRQRAMLAEGLSVPAGERLDADAILADIFAMLEGRPVMIGDETVENLASGEAVRILSDAAVDRARLINGRQAALQLYLAKLEQYRENPEVMLGSEWNAAMAQLTSRDFVQQYFVPDYGGLRQFLINQDPQIVRALDEAQKRREATEAAEARTNQLLNERFSTPTGVFARPDP